VLIEGIMVKHQGAIPGGLINYQLNIAALTNHTAGFYILFKKNYLHCGMNPCFDMSL